ncbi:excinuclease ABC subunit C [Granulicella paludicola]|uniref:excinuclease ABC subunit C n=1 Tax=Granulicella paludicola TaxID=474951 RepID=UPI0021E080D9|nr:excinuclease ABC subunit C [Granulicella paludicola]
MSAPPIFEHHLDFTPESADEILRSIPAAPGVFSLRGPDTPDGKPGEPYLTRTADLRRRLRRLLAPPEALDEKGNAVLSKRLNLRDRVRTIAYTRTGSDFESTLLLYHASRLAFGTEQARKRLRLHTPYLIRVTMSHEHPRAYVTNRLSKKSVEESFGPFPSRAAAERYCDAVLDLFKLRRCYEDLTPHPDHPGCVYGEMNKCLMPCKGASAEGEPANPAACTPEQYTAEAQRVHSFFTTRGESLLTEIAAQRELASESMDFESAAAHHKHWEKVRAAALLSDELVRPVTELRALILQEAAPRDDEPQSFSSREDAAVFLFANGHLTTPTRLSTLGVRAVREQTAVGSSLFAQPLMLAPVPLDEPVAPPRAAVISTEAQRSGEPPVFVVAKDEGANVPSPLSSTPTPLSSPEDRTRALITQLTERTGEPAILDELCDSLSLFRRWYYRPEKQRPGEVFLPNGAVSTNDPATAWPIRRILNGAARVVLGPPTEASPIDREAAKAHKTKILHPGREGIEREVPVLPKRTRARKAITPTDVLE